MLGRLGQFAQLDFDPILSLQFISLIAYHHITWASRCHRRPSYSWSEFQIDEHLKSGSVPNGMERACIGYAMSRP